MELTAEIATLIEQGLVASDVGDVERAVCLFDRAATADASSGLLQFLLASALVSAGDTTGSELAFARAVLLAPSFTPARYHLGLLQFSSRRVPLALLTWYPLLALPETDALLHFVRGFTALAQDDFDLSLQHMRAGLACGSDNAALCSDVLQLVEAVERLQASREPAASAHVLLSAYAGGLH